MSVIYAGISRANLTLDIFLVEPLHGASFPGKVFWEKPD